MCLIAFAINAHERCPLLIASNRDEFWHRPTRPLSAWRLHNGTEVYSGQDALAGGTWLGFSTAGRVAMLTNVRSGEPATAPRSRGDLVTHWLAGADTAPDWPDFFEQFAPQDFGGFNLVLGDLGSDAWVWLSNNRPEGLENQTDLLPTPAGWYGRKLGKGVYGLSNAGLDTPWPKTLALKNATRNALNTLGKPEDSAEWQQVLLSHLLDLRCAADEDLPSTGVPLERERALSSAFVHMPEAGYGTRSSLLAHWDGQQLLLDEWTHPVEPVSAPAQKWPLEHSTHKRMAISMWGMPTSS